MMLLSGLAGIVIGIVTFLEQGDHYYGRGTTDDKGPALTALLSTARTAQDIRVTAGSRAATFSPWAACCTACSPETSA